jgi:hypothetical protein
MADSLAARAAITSFVGRTGEVRGAAILGPAGVLAASGSESSWSEAGEALLDAADRAAGSPATHAHVATEEGEVFAVRAGPLVMVAVASRFALASLVFADMRAALRDACAAGDSVVSKEAA